MNGLKKPAHTVSTDELLDVLDNIEDAEPIQYVNDALLFISTFQIEPGTDRIKQNTLYNIYKVWSKDPLKKAQFQTEIREYLASTQFGKSAAYLINQSAIKLTHAAYKHFTNENHKLTPARWTKHYETFLKFHALKPGDYWIHWEILYFIYDKYTHATGLDQKNGAHMSKNSFGLYCKIFLKEKITQQGKYYGISDNIKQFFQIDQLERMQTAYAKEENKKKRGRPPKSKGKLKPKDQI